MDFVRLPNEAWTDFFEGMTALMRGKLVEIDVVGLDLGVALEAEWLPLIGIYYDSADDQLYVLTDPVVGLDHAIDSPREIYVELGEAGVNQVVVTDGDGQRHFLKLRAPLELPAPEEAPGQPPAGSPPGS